MLEPLYITKEINETSSDNQHEEEIDMKHITICGRKLYHATQINIYSSKYNISCQWGDLENSYDIFRNPPPKKKN